jgi:RNA polymerase sigma-70 factor (ECF subfamily)
MKELDTITIQRAIRGDKGAFKSLYNHYSPFLWRILFKMCSGDQAEAQELLQESFVKVHSSLKSFKSMSAFSTWIYRITYNIAINTFSRKKGHSFISFDDTVQGNSKTDQYEDSEILQKILKGISPEDRFLLIAKELDGLSYDELAEITKQTPGALRTKLHRLKEELRGQSEKILTGGLAHA